MATEVHPAVIEAINSLRKSMDGEFATLQARVKNIEHSMATKSDISELREQLDRIEAAVNGKYARPSQDIPK